ncbi:MAG: biotin synthase BioB [Akkermansia sp.]
MTLVDTLEKKVTNGNHCTQNELLQLVDAPLDELCAAADRIREHFCGNTFDLCTIINARSGRCSENCKYCAQSAHYNTPVDEYPLLNTASLLEGAKYNQTRGVLRYSVVTSGKRLSDADVDQLCQSYATIAAECHIGLCASHGLLSLEHCKRLKEAGVTRYHNNLETSRRNFPNVCTTHTYDDKIQTIKWAQQAGLEVCSGGIMGLGETMADRIDMFCDIAALGIKSTPINFLTPIPGTPYEHLTPMTEEEKRRIIAIVRFIIPDGAVRIAAGRDTMSDNGVKAFQSGANAAISGDMLTTAGVSIKSDIAMLHDLGYDIRMN